MIVIKYFFSAVAFLTAIPIPQHWQLKEYADAPGYYLFFPKIGFLIGLFIAAVAWFIVPFIGNRAGALLLLIAYYLLTGALHLDGAADCADAFYGKKDQSTILRIMKDPTVGTMGAGMIVMILLIKYIMFSDIPLLSFCLALPFIVMLSRVAPLAFMLTGRYVRQNGIASGTIFPGTGSLIIVVSGTFLISGVFLPLPTLAVLIAVIVFILYCRKKIGGFTGDCLGAAIELSEIVAFFMLLITINNSWYNGAFTWLHRQVSAVL
jgi:adenosylcobinamide-GDP ribazoletransferase